MSGSSVKAASRLLIVAPSKLQEIQDQNDLNIAITYDDPGGSDERIATVTYSSASLGESVTLTLTYGGISGGFYLTNVAYS